MLHHPLKTDSSSLQNAPFSTADHVLGQTLHADPRTRHPRQEAAWPLTCSFHLLREAAGVPLQKAHPAPQEMLYGHPIPWDPNLQGDGLTSGVDAHCYLCPRRRPGPSPQRAQKDTCPLKTWEQSTSFNSPNPELERVPSQAGDKMGNFLHATLSQVPPPTLPDEK